MNAVRKRLVAAAIAGLVMLSSAAEAHAQFFPQFQGGMPIMPGAMMGMPMMPGMMMPGMMPPGMMPGMFMPPGGMFLGQPFPGQFAGGFVGQPGMLAQGGFPVAPTPPVVIVVRERVTRFGLETRRQKIITVRQTPFVAPVPIILMPMPLMGTSMLTINGQPGMMMGVMPGMMLGAPTMMMGGMPGMLGMPGVIGGAPGMMLGLPGGVFF